MPRIRPKLGVVLFLAEAMGWERALAWARESGFEAIEVPVARVLHPDRIDSSTLAAVRSGCADNGLHVIGVNSVYPFGEGYQMLSPDPAVRRRAVDYLKRVIDSNAEIGGQVVTIGSPHARSIPAGMSYEEGWKYAVEVFGEWAAYCEPRGQIVSLEVLNRYESNIGLTMDEGSRLIAEVGSRAVGLTPDTYHGNIDEDPIVGAIERNVRNLANFHMGDSNRQAPGQGNYDFHRTLGALVNAGYDRCISLELMDVYIGVRLRQPFAEALEAGRNYLTRVLDDVMA